MRRNLFLYLALACFIALIAIFIVDGYMGIYDTLYVTVGEREQKVEPDYWLQRDNSWSVGSNWGEKAFFRYEMDNRQFSTYSTEVSVSVWHSQQKVRDLMPQPMSVSAFGKGELEWVIDNTELLPKDIPPEQSYQYTVIIKRGGIERRVIIYINPEGYPKLIPTPSR